METLQQKWDAMNAAIDEMSAAFIDNFFKELGKPIPTIIYHLQSFSRIMELRIDKAYIMTKPYRPSLYNKRPTRKDVEELQEYYNNFVPKIEDVFLAYTQIHETFKSSGAYRYVKIGIEDKRVSFERKTLLPLQEELRQLYEPREGYSPCAYCGKQIPTETMVPYEIIFQDSRRDPFSRTGYAKFVNRKTNMYCSKTCGVNDQMGHEG